MRVRSEGAGLLIQAKLPLGGLVTNHVVFSGNGDVVQTPDLAAEGVVVPIKYEKGYANEEEVAEIFNIKEITPARSAVPRKEVHVADDGREVTLSVPAATRRMRIRR